MSNPLLDDAHLPAFDNIKAEHFVPAIESVLAESRQQIDALAANALPTWAGLVTPLEIIQNRIHQVWSPARHMNSVVNSDEIQASHDACLPFISDFYTEFGQHEGLYNKFEALKNSPEYAQFSAQQKQVVDNYVRDFTLSGIALSGDKKQRFKEIQSRLSEITSKFSNNVLSATNAWFKHVEDEALLAGIPDAAKGLFAQHAEQRQLKGWVITLDFPCYLPVMTYADDRGLREEVYAAFCTRASDQGPHSAEFDNSALMCEILALRHESATLLAFNNYAELSIAKKMAPTTDKVISFLEELATKSVDTARTEFADLQVFSNEQGGPEILQAWDVTYYSEKLREQQFAINEEQLKPYFALNKVVEGLFSVAERLFGVHIAHSETIADKWHDDVQFFDVKDKDGSLRGQFYLDPFARTGKRGGAWMDDAVVRVTDSAGNTTTPVAYLVCNFTPPVGDTPSLLTHREVETLFHEFGHGIHHMLTKISDFSVSGINGVEWDAVELPSQFMENWCWHYEALSTFAKHWQTGETIPEDLVNRLRSTQHFQAGMQTVRQIEFSLFDFLIHKNYTPENTIPILDTLQQVRKGLAVVPTPDYNRFSHSFSHIFAGGYAAGYYSYKWAEVLSADAFEEFDLHGIFNQEVGQRFLREILEQGGSRPALESFVAFKGREPGIDALLKQYGLAA